MRPTDHGYRYVPRWREPFTCEWSMVVGDRIRRLTLAAGPSLRELASLLPCPRGGMYSGSTLSRLERGRASAPFFVYLAIADALEVDPGRLLGPDEAQSAASGAEITMLKLLRRLQLSPEEAIARLLREGIREARADEARRATD